MLDEIFLKGLAIGLAVAAPVGPIGLLCIKRSLNNGFMAGFTAGLGAATADALYGLLAATGFAATGLLVSYAMPMALFGGALITLLGALSIKSFFANKEKKNALKITKGGLISAYGTTFLLTLSNPLTILTFIGFIAALGSSANQNDAAPYILVLGVFLGSALWWIFLSTSASLISKKLRTGQLKWLDLLSGLILTLWGLWLIIGTIFS